MPTHPRITFAGITFAAPRRGLNTFTVPIPALKKIMASGKVVVTCTNDLTDDYAGDAGRNFGRGVVTPDKALEGLELGKPWLLYFCSNYHNIGRVIRFCPMQSLNYDVREL